MGQAFDDGDWFAVHRKIENSAVFMDAELLRLWLKLLIRARFTEGSFTFSNGITIKKGQCVISQELLAREFKCSKSTINRRLQKLQNLNQIRTQPVQNTERGGTIITICNWDTYQQSEAVTRNDSGTTAERQRNDSGTTAEPEEEGKKEERREEGKKKNSVPPTGSADQKNHIPPLLAWVEEYCHKRRNGVDAERFCDHYTARGWKLSNGRKMHDWKAAVRTWEKNSFDRGRTHDRNQPNRRTRLRGEYVPSVPPYDGKSP